MSLSTRLTRVGLTLLVFGALSAVLPTTAISYASSGPCPGSSSGGDTKILGLTSDGQKFAAGVLGAGVIYGATSGLFVAGGNDKKKKNSKLDHYVYHGDQSNP